MSDRGRNKEMIMRGYTTDMSPCPFCESGKLVVARYIASTWLHAVRCEHCGAEGPPVKEHDYLNNEAVAAEAIGMWNQRP